MKLLDEATDQLARAGVDSARTDAALLLAHVLDLDRSRLLTLDTVDAVATARFAELIARRATREPLQYITGEAPFRFALLAVGPGVFIPRPETELLVDAVLPSLRAVREPLVVDLCSGSGALAVSIAHEVPAAHVIAVERSEAALPWLRRNTAGTQIEIVAADVMQFPADAELWGQVDAIVSNPPYVPSAVAVSPEVTHDPADAVFAGADGLAVIPAVIDLAARLLRLGGVLALEHDESHSAAVIARFDPAQWTDATTHRDLTGRDRYATAVRR
jgi:release factor glutamine methyltransferase